MRKDRFVVGYLETGNVVYGKYHTGVGKKKVLASEDYAQPMTEYQAKRALRQLKNSGGVIFKLVPIN